MNRSGIYEIVNTINGKSYLGSAGYLPRRRAQHWHLLRSGKHHTRYLQHAWNFYGEDAFPFRPVLFCEKSELLRYEQELLDRRKPAYNGSRSAERPAGPAGWKHSLEARERIRLAGIGRTHSPEVRAKMSAMKRGIKFTDEHRDKLSAARQSQPLSARCRRGHSYSGPESSVYVAPNGKRSCRACKRIRANRAYHIKKEEGK